MTSQSSKKVAAVEDQFRSQDLTNDGGHLLSDEHKALRQTLWQFVEKEITPHVGSGRAKSIFPDSVFRRLGELGYLGLRFPKELGGQGWDYPAVIVRTEELVRSGSMSLVSAISVHAEMAIPPIERFGGDELKRLFLIPTIKGEKLAALGITEPGAGSDVASIETFARRNGDEWVISGHKIFITIAARPAVSCDQGIAASWGQLINTIAGGAFGNG